MSRSEERLDAIQKIIQSEDVCSQSQLLELLEQHYQISTTQAVISRDLKKLGAVMKTKGAKRVYSLLHQDTHQEMLKLAIHDIQHNESLIVIHTTAGTADFVGDLIDSKDLDILGCVSGENNIIVVPKSIHKIKETYQALCQALYFQNKG